MLSSEQTCFPWGGQLPRAAGLGDASLFSPSTPVYLLPGSPQPHRVVLDSPCYLTTDKAKSRTKSSQA